MAGRGRRYNAPACTPASRLPCHPAYEPIPMITCYLRYVIDTNAIAEFETYAKMWIPLVERFGGTHHGYFMPSEGANNIALALFSFPSLAAYETYRQDSLKDAECQQAYAYATQTRCIVSYERSFFRPVFG
jgi:uncharacterized protein (DUF1330 family)